MSVIDAVRFLTTNKVLHGAYRECCRCIKDVEKANKIVLAASVHPGDDFKVRAASFPPQMFLPQRNFFSTCFQSVYTLLDIPQERRLLYGRMNYLFRIWVTSADNLLDGEDKLSLPMRIPKDSRVMRQVIAIMAADRMLQHFLSDALNSGLLTSQEALRISDGTLQVLLPSAAEEASEECGISVRPEPDYVLHEIHRLKTGILFHLPLFGPQMIEKKIDRKMLSVCREGLGSFGIGCQLLDDVRDMARDLVERRHNYVLSLMTHEFPASMRKLMNSIDDIKIEDRLYPSFHDEAVPAVRLAYDHLLSGLARLDECGLGLNEAAARQIALWMFKALDVDQARRWLK